MKPQQRQVTFAGYQEEYFAPLHHSYDTNVVEAVDSSSNSNTVVCSKSLRWYSPEDLISTREESREALQALHAADGDCGKVPPHVCVRGIEKFANLSAKLQSERMLKTTVLQQQYQEPEATAAASTPQVQPTEHDDVVVNTNNMTTMVSKSHQQKATRKRKCPEQLAVLSRYLSQPARSMAHQLGLMNAQEVAQENKLMERTSSTTLPCERSVTPTNIPQDLAPSLSAATDDESSQDEPSTTARVVAVTPPTPKRHTLVSEGFLEPSAHPRPRKQARRVPPAYVHSTTVESTCAEHTQG